MSGSSNVSELIKAIQGNEVLHAQTREIEEKFKTAIDEYIDLAAEYGVTLTHEDFRYEKDEAIVEKENSDPDFKEKTGALDGRLRQYVADYIALAKKYGITLKPSDFNPMLNDD